MNSTAPPETPDFVLHPRWIVPVVPRGAVLEHHSLAVTAGRITDILPSETARSWQTVDHVELPDQALLPGLVNAHGHGAMALLRGIADDYPLMEWLQQHMLAELEPHTATERQGQGVPATPRMQGGAGRLPSGPGD